MSTTSDVLSILYASTGGSSSWLSRLNWLDGTPCLAGQQEGNWYGLKCDFSGNLVGIDLNQNGLGGSLPSELALLTTLQSALFKISQLEGTLPNELFSLPMIQDVDLGLGSFTGSIPSTIGLATNLQTLGVDDNLLRGTIPSELGSATSLRELLLGSTSDDVGNVLSGFIPSQLGRLSLMNVEFALQHNELTGGQQLYIPSAFVFLSCMIPPPRFILGCISHSFFPTILKREHSKRAGLPNGAFGGVQA